ncbi:MAG: hypothetical protein LBO08_01125 [Rickettsiales bacterium]|jgi:hypothetical protein|nr:hypothetical protein [Rickettsiales bacterium]
MKKIILPVALCSALFALCACGGPRSQLSPGANPHDGYAVFVARVDLDPAINDDWERAEDSDKKFTQFSVLMPPADAAQNLDDDQLDDYTYGDIETNKFFAIEIPVDAKPEIRNLRFFAQHKAFWLSNTDHFYYTTLSNPSFDVGAMPKAGNAYYLGTIKIGLGDKSFASDDGKIDYDEWQFAVPKTMTVADESAAAQEWFNENHKNIAQKLKSAKITPKQSGKDNEFLHKSITTTRY